MSTITLTPVTTAVSDKVQDVIRGGVEPISDRKSPLGMKQKSWNPANF